MVKMLFLRINEWKADLEKQGYRIDKNRNF